MVNGLHRRGGGDVALPQKQRQLSHAEVQSAEFLINRRRLDGRVVLIALSGPSCNRTTALAVELLLIELHTGLTRLLQELPYRLRNE